MRAMTRPHAMSHRGFPLAWLVLLAVCAGCSSNQPPTAPVVIPPLSAVIVTPDSAVLKVGDRTTFTATALDTAHQPAGSIPFSWSSSDPKVATVDALGRVTATGEGIALVVAAAGGRSDTATVLVFPGQAGWFTQTSFTARNLLGVFFLHDGRSGWAVGSGGAIIHTVDAGSTWSTQVSGSAVNLNAVWFTGASEGWAVGNSGTVLHTLDGGQRWSRVNVSSGQNLMDVCFANPSIGWAVGSNGVLLRTRDGGVTWDAQTLTGATLRGVSASSARDVWMVSDVGEIFGTHSGGDTVFRVLPAITAQPLRSVWTRSRTLAWAVGDAGLAPRTVVAAPGDTASWELRNAGASFQLRAVIFPSDLVGFAAGFNGVGAILRSDDAGATWQAQTSNTSRPLNDVFFVDPLRGWAVGDGGTIVHTATGGVP
jgi:photosystem II stability/assembly factor-like uncharacterized protein